MKVFSALLHSGIACMGPLVIGCAAGPRAEPERDYFDAKSRFDSAAIAVQRTGRDPHDTVMAALKDLESRTRAILGPISIPGATSRINLEWLPSGGAGGQVLDGLLFSDSTGRTRVIVTTPALIAGWLKMDGDTTKDPLAAIQHEDRLTFVFWDDAHVYPFADLRKKASLPGEVLFAFLVDRTNGDPFRPEEIMVGIRQRNRIFLILTPAAATVTAPDICGVPHEDEVRHRQCFDAHAVAHPEFPKIVAQVRELAKSVAGW